MLVTLTLAATSCKGNQEKNDTPVVSEAVATEQTNESTEEPQETEEVSNADSDEYTLVYDGTGKALEDYTIENEFIEDHVYSDIPCFNSIYRNPVNTCQTANLTIVTYADEEDQGKSNEEVFESVMKEKLETYTHSGLMSGDLLSYDLETEEDVTVNDVNAKHYKGVFHCGNEETVVASYYFEAYAFTYDGYPCFMMGVCENEYEENSDVINQCADDISKNLELMIHSVRSTEEK